MATTQNTFTGNGSNLGPFSFTFKWLESTDIKVSVGGVLRTAGTHYNLQSLNYTTKTGGQVLFTAGNAPANGASIRIFRDTDDDALSAVFSSGSAIRAKDLNDNFTQNLYVTQEINNNAVSIDGSNPMVSDFNMNGYKITNLAAPVAGTDAANRSFVEGVFSSEVPVFYRRWSKTAAGGETSLSGNDNSGIALSYVPGSEKVFINGALQIRGVDYSGTTGSTLTAIPALTAGDIVEVHSSSSYTVGTVPDGSVTNAKVDGGAGIQSTKLAFTQAGTGATTRTVESKLRDVVSVKDFGAVGDGVANDTAAIQAAITANPGKLILIPSGTYKITNTILVAVSGSDAACVRIVGSGSTQTIINNQFAGPAFKFDSGAGAVFAYDVALENLQITSVGSVAGSIGVQLDGCRFARISNVRITSMASHGIYGFSIIGDLTDTAQIEVKQTEISSCGGYGIYAKSDTSAIQYNWNLDQVRVGGCTLGGVLYESMVNATVRNSGIFYNNGFGLKVNSPVGGNASRVIRIENCEFDTNNGTQIYLGRVEAVNVSQCYLVGNTGLSQVFSKGIFVDSTAVNVVIENAYPRLAPALTGVNVIEVAAGATDIVARDTNYNGYSVGNGNMYVDNTTTSQLVIDDKLNRNRSYKGTHTVQVGNLSNATVSSTTVTAYYSVTGNSITVSFRNLDNIDLTGFPGSSILTFTLPKTCITGATAGFIGNCILTVDAGSASQPFVTVDNGSNKALLVRANGSFVTQADLTSGSSDVKYFTIDYMWE